MKTFRPAVSIVLSALLAVLPIVSCSDNPVNSSAKADITLAGNQNDMSSEIFSHYDLISAAAKNPGQTLTIALAQDGNQPIMFKLRFNSNHDPIITRPDGREARVELGFENFKPVIRLKDPRTGDKLAQEEIKGDAAAKIARGEQINLMTDWAEAGMVAVGAAIVAWLGLQAIGLAVAGIGSLVLLARVVGAAVGVGGTMAKVFKAMGWSLDDFIGLFRQSASNLADIISGAIRKFEETYNQG